MKITKEILESLDCCSPRLEKFVSMFPDGAEITPALCEKHAGDFNWDWPAMHLLTPSAYAKFESIRTEAFHKWTAAGEGEGPLLEYKRTCARAFGKLAHEGGLAESAH